MVLTQPRSLLIESEGDSPPGYVSGRYRYGSSWCSGHSWQTISQQLSGSSHLDLRTWISFDHEVQGRLVAKGSPDRVAAFS